ncbi:hypothetical protein HTV45_23170 [Streptomyces sp. CHD11]|uniref:DUF3786 domain-containing protein n=1 Tax=Streptomyces sp. CHD11 TaxID=2741325 RepID=UPI001BFCC6DF|nr:DUF3786 domain-containing protein [Streptomyces sp. CHD11]MBT3153735.1 hypothetical protein [Streptomyces sp. CHD11]
MTDPGDYDAAWLPSGAFRAAGSRRSPVRAAGPLADTVYRELADACERFGGQVVRGGDGDAGCRTSG